MRPRSVSSAALDVAADNLAREVVAKAIAEAVAEPDPMAALLILAEARQTFTELTGGAYHGRTYRG